MAQNANRPCRTATETLVPLQSKEGTLARKLTEVALKGGRTKNHEDVCCKWKALIVDLGKGYIYVYIYYSSLNPWGKVHIGHPAPP